LKTNFVLKTNLKFQVRSSTMLRFRYFNGAGFIRFKTGNFRRQHQTFEKAINNFWASSGNEASYNKRALFGIDQQQVAMEFWGHRFISCKLAMAW
ncbi:pyruvate, phosphate dikinase, partial [Flavobacterium procerum]